MSQFRDIITIGFDKNGEVDFRISMAIAELDRPKMDEICRMIPWSIKEALTIWLTHGPVSRELMQCAVAERETK